MRRYLTLIGLLAAAFTVGGVLVGDAAAVESGDTIEFLIPADGIQPDPPAAPADGLIYHGGPVTMIDIAGCGLGSHPVQNATLVDVGSDSGRVEVITVSHSEPIPAGTRVKTLTATGACTIGTTFYFRHQGVVD